MKAYNIVFGDTKTSTIAKNPNLAASTVKSLNLPDKFPDGWAGYSGPSIPWYNWPRNPKTKTPLMHYLTIRVPDEYKPEHRKNFAAISVFQGDGLIWLESAPRLFNIRTPFVKDYEKYVPHPEYLELEDDIAIFGFMWLTEDEFSQGPVMPQPDMRHDWEKEKPEEVSYLTPLNTWDNFYHEQVPDYSPAWLIERNDPNTGKIPNEFNEHGYNSSFKEDTEHLEWEGVHEYSHFGGTTFAIQGIPELTPYYLELEAYPGIDLGDSGNLQLDLHTNYFDWSQC